MDPTVLSVNLRRIRTAKGKSQVEVAEAAGLSRPGYRNIEGGATAPRADTLVRIADALGVRLEALLAPVRELRAARFRANKKMNTRGELLSEVAVWLDDYNDLEEILGCREACAFAHVAESLGTAVRGLERAKLAAKRARKRAGLSDKEIIHDVCGVVTSRSGSRFRRTSIDLGRGLGRGSCRRTSHFQSLIRKCSSNASLILLRSANQVGAATH